MSNEVITEYGVDINSSWDFTDGDLNLISDADNLCQAIMNRLNTTYDSLDLFYTGYGSFLLKFLGWKLNTETLNFIKLELDNCISNDVRISNFETEVYSEDGVVKIKIVVYYSFDANIELNYVLTEDGVSEVE